MKITIDLEEYFLLQTKSRTITREFCVVDSLFIEQMKLASPDNSIWKQYHAEPIVDTSLFNLWHKSDWERSIKAKDINHSVKHLVVEQQQIQAKINHGFVIGLLRAGYNTKQLEAINRLQENYNIKNNVDDNNIRESFIKLVTALKNKNLEAKQISALMEGVVRPTLPIHNILRTKMGLDTVVLESAKDIVNLELM